MGARSRKQKGEESGLKKIRGSGQGNLASEATEPRTPGEKKRANRRDDTARRRKRSIAKLQKKCSKRDTRSENGKRSETKGRGIAYVI